MRVHFLGAGLALLGLAIQVHAGAPVPRFRRLGVEQGLSHPEVFWIAQDAHGFLWFATAGGLDRYDGYTLKSFTEHARAGGWLGSADFSTVVRSRSGDLWVGTWGRGLYHVAFPSLKVTAYRHAAEDASSLSDDRVQTIRETGDGVLWIGTFRGLNRFDPEAGLFERLRHDEQDPASLSADRIWALAEGSKGHLWLATQQGVDQLDPRTHRVTRHDVSTVARPPIRAVLQGRDALWFGSGNGLGRIDPRSGAPLAVRLAPEHRAQPTVSVLLEDSGGAVWAGTIGDGLFRIGSTGEVTAYHPHHADENGLTFQDVRALHEDAGGLLWIGTRGGGVNSLDLRPARFQHLGSGPVYDLIERRDGTLWTAEFSGLARYDPRTGAELGRVKPDRVGVGGLWDVPIALAEDAQGHLWVGTRAGLDRLPFGEERFVHYLPDPDDPRSLSPGGVQRLLVSRSGQLWLGTGTGLARYDAEHDRFIHHRHAAQDPNSLSTDWVLSLHETRDGSLWVGTDVGGLNHFDPSSGRFRRYRHDPDDPHSLAADRVTTICESRDGTLWVGTDGGLSRLDRRTQRFTHLTRADGLPSNNIMAVLEDDDGRLWISSNGGLSRWQPDDGSVRTFHPDDGLQGRVFSPGAARAGRAGTLLFGGYGGFNRFPAGDPPQVTAAPPVVLTGFTVFNRPYDLGQPAETVRSIQVAHTDWNLGFEFAALDFRNPSHNRFAVRFDGPEWHELGTHHHVDYTRVPPGRYTLEVRAAGSDGLWNDEGLRLAVVVTPPFHATLWFRALAVTLVLLAAVAVHRLRVRSLKRHQAELEIKVGERTAEVERQRAELESAYRQVKEASISDPLTGLRNRRFLTEAIGPDVAACLRRHEEDAGTPPENADIIFLLLDLDHFKSVNDSYGHGAGDAVLGQVAQLLRRTCRASDHLVRWGGEEFLVVTRQVARADAFHLAERVRSAMQEHPFNVCEGRTVRLTCSLGFASFPFLPSAAVLLSWEDVVTIADHALYAAKRSGRNAWVGLTAGPACAPGAALMAHLRADPAACVRSGEVQVQASLTPPAEPRWS